MNMTNGYAIAICDNIDQCELPDDMKGIAIWKMMNMETHNGVTKKTLLKVIRYLHELCFDVEINESFEFERQEGEG